MGRRTTKGGVTPKGDRIELTFFIGKKRYRPTIERAPNQVNLRQAAFRLKRIKEQVATGTFVFTEEFPDYKFIDDVAPVTAVTTFDATADLFEKAIGDLQYATRESYRKILKSFWRKELGPREMISIKYSELAAIIGGHPWKSIKTRNNVLSVGKRVFDFFYADVDGKTNPAEKLKSLRVQRPIPDPYSLEDALSLIAKLREKWGDSDANYFEFGFFTGLRPSEEIALMWPDCDLKNGIVRIDKARVMAQDKGTTKTAEARDVELCPHALLVLKRQFDITGMAGKQVFGPYHDLQDPWKRWAYTHKRLQVRYRVPYNVRHTSVSWNLMIGKNLMWVAQQHGHSAAVMLKTYAKWLSGSSEADVDAIRAAMGYATTMPLEARK